MKQAIPKFRQATLSDIYDLLELSLRTTRASYPAFLGEEAVEAFIASGALDSFVRSSIGQTLVITLDNQIAGLAVNRDNHIDQLMIDERYHRRGLGTQLLAHLEKMLFEQHYRLHLESFRDNDQANAFYQRHGWLKTAEFQDEDFGTEMIRMQKDTNADTH